MAATSTKSGSNSIQDASRKVPSSRSIELPKEEIISDPDCAVGTCEGVHDRILNDSSYLPTSSHQYGSYAYYVSNGIVTPIPNQNRTRHSVAKCVQSHVTTPKLSSSRPFFKDVVSSNVLATKVNRQPCSPTSSQLALQCLSTI